MTTQSIQSMQSVAISSRFAALPDILTRHDVIAFLPIGRNAVYNAIKRQALKSMRVGQKILITKAAQSGETR